MTFLELENYFFKKYFIHNSNSKPAFNLLIFHLSKIVNISSDLIFKRNNEIDFDFKKLEKMFLKYLNKKIPIAYLTKEINFLNHSFFINKSVLIPRIESELVFNDFVNSIQNKIKKDDVILDLCTGSGVFAINLADIFSHQKIYGSDISSKALIIAKKNLKIYQFKNVNFIKANFLNVIKKIPFQIDYVICNPPYIDKNDPNIQTSVKNNEPKVALFSKEKGLYYYRIFFEKLINDSNFCPKVCVFEIGYNQKEPILKLFNLIKPIYDISFFKDKNNNYRWFKIIRK